MPDIVLRTMTSESPERQLFDKYKEIMIKHLGNKALDDKTIHKVGSKLSQLGAGYFQVIESNFNRIITTSLM